MRVQQSPFEISVQQIKKTVVNQLKYAVTWCAGQFLPACLYYSNGSHGLFRYYSSFRWPFMCLASTQDQMNGQLAAVDESSRESSCTRLQTYAAGISYSSNRVTLDRFILQHLGAQCFPGVLFQYSFFNACVYINNMPLVLSVSLDVIIRDAPI